MLQFLFDNKKKNKIQIHTHTRTCCNTNKWYKNSVVVLNCFFNFVFNYNCRINASDEYVVPAVEWYGIMEIDVKQRRQNQRNRRRERAQRMQAERDKDVAIGGSGGGVVGGGNGASTTGAGAGIDPDSGEEDVAAAGGGGAPHVRDKPPRPPLRRKKPKEPSPLLEEDIIDGFSILGFKSYEDLEVSKNLFKYFELKLGHISFGIILILILTYEDIHTFKYLLLEKS